MRGARLLSSYPVSKFYIQRCLAEILQLLIFMVGKYKVQLIFTMSGISTRYQRRHCN